MDARHWNIKVTVVLFYDYQSPLSGSACKHYAFVEQMIQPQVDQTFSKMAFFYFVSNLVTNNVRRNGETGMGYEHTFLLLLQGGTQFCKQLISSQPTWFLYLLIDAFTADVTLPKSHHACAGRLIQTHTAHRIQCKNGL